MLCDNVIDASPASSSGTEDSLCQRLDLCAAAAARSGQPAPVLQPFTVTPQQALSAFKQYQRAMCFNLHASDLLGAEHTLQPVFMPFWLFEAEVSTEALATLGRKADQ